MMDSYKKLLFCVFLLLYGCASFNNRVVPPLEPNATMKDAPKKSISFFADVKAHIDIGNNRYDFVDVEYNEIKINDIISKELLSSGFFSTADANKKNVDFILLISVTKNASISWWHEEPGMMLKCLALLLFPTKDIYYWDFEIYVLNRAGKKLAEYHVQESYNMWSYVFLLPVASYYSIKKAKVAVVVNVIRELVNRMKEDKIL